ncbi:hypothetical protein N431DRAFT_431800 [Stipitochalara longipes BDJ]|nr:hypothetical protein N431DRAFT_431800 [Stipitochalara longipes BDJ]
MVRSRSRSTLLSSLTECVDVAARECQLLRLSQVLSSPLNVILSVALFWSAGIPDVLPRQYAKERKILSWKCSNSSLTIGIGREKL